MTSSRAYYSRQGLRSLYLACVFPLYFWTLLLGFRDVSWVTERTNMWDAVGVISYGMIFAFVESTLLFVVAALLGFLVSRSWNMERRAALMCILVLVTSLWAILNQAYFVWQLPIPAPLLWLLVYTGRPVLTMNIVLAALVIPSVVVPAYFILHSDKGLKAAQDFIERISLLSMLYLFLGFAGLIVVVIRNI